MANPHLSCVDRAGNLLPRSPMCWNCRCALHHQAWLCLPSSQESHSNMHWPASKRICSYLSEHLSIRRILKSSELNTEYTHYSAAGLL